MDDVELLALFNAVISLLYTTNRVLSNRRQRRRYLFGLLHQTGLNLNRVHRGPYCKCGTTFLLSALQNGTFDLRKDFRVSRKSFLKLVSIIKDEKQHGWQAEIEGLIFLFWLACGCAYRVVTRSCGVPVATICRIVHKQLGTITENIHKFIHYPNPEEYPAVTHGFATLSGTPAIGSAIGAIDGTHTRIVPPSESKESYINRKCQYTVQTQAVCNHEGVFVHVYTGFPGSVHDARVYRSSPVATDQDFPPDGFYLLADTAYPASRRLLTPFKEPEASRPMNKRFNYHHSKARCIIERAFGLLKVRWRSIFTKDIELRASLAPHIIAACCAMHNLCHASGDVWEEDDDDDYDMGGEEDTPENEMGAQVVDDAAGMHIRARIAQMISAPVEYPQHIADEHDYFMLPNAEHPTENEC